MIQTLIDYYDDIINSIKLKYNNFFEVFNSVLEKSKNISGVCDHCSELMFKGTNFLEIEGMEGKSLNLQFCNTGCVDECVKKHPFLDTIKVKTVNGENTVSKICHHNNFTFMFLNPWIFKLSTVQLYEYIMKLKSQEKITEGESKFLEQVEYYHIA